jgi:hypothetical protein
MNATRHFRKQIAVAAVGTLLSLAALAEGPYGSYDDITDGTAGAQLGTLIYNTINPDSPLPMPEGDGAVIEGTIYNMGSGQGRQEAWDNAVYDATGSGSVR